MHGTSAIIHFLGVAHMEYLVVIYRYEEKG
jgi:hypothetical protein